MALCLIVALTPLVFAARLFEPYIAAKEIFVQAGTATIALLWLFTARVKSWGFPLTPVWIPLLALAVIGGASMLWSSNAAISFEKGRYLATYILLFAITLSVMRQAEARTALATAIMLAGAIEAVYVLLQYSFGDPFFATADLAGKWQTFGTFGNPNWTGEFLAVAALVSFGHFVHLRAKTQPTAATRLPASYLTLAALILILLALAATLARGAWLAFIIGSIAFVMIHRFGDVPLRLRTLILPLAFTGVAAVVVIVVPLVTNREAIDHLLNLKSMSGRILMWRVTGTMIMDAPLTGHGLGTFGLHFPNYQADALSQPWAEPFIANASFTSYAHNDYLQLWAELGLFGLLAFGALIWIVLKRGRALAGDPVALGCWAAVISLLINSAVAFPLHLPTTLILFVVLVAAVEGTVPEKSRDQANLVVPKRLAIVFVTLVLCFSAYWFSYNRFVADAALWRAQAALGSERLGEAEADIRTAIRHAPTRLEGQVMLGRLLVERGEYAQALSALNKAPTLGFDTLVFDLKATAYEASGQRIEAIATLNEIVRLRPDLQWPRTRLALLSTPPDSQEDKQ